MKRLFKIPYLYGRNGIETDICLIEENSRIIQKTKLLKISGRFDATYNLHGVVMPSFVNGHTHLELSAVDSLLQPQKSEEKQSFPKPTYLSSRPSSFVPHYFQGSQSHVPSLWDWIIDVVKTKRSWSDADFEKNIKAGEKILLERGTGVAGDIRSILPQAPCFFDEALQGTVFYEVLGYDNAIFNAKWEALQIFLKGSSVRGLAASGRMSPDCQSPQKGISIHSLYTTPFDAACEALKFARKNNLMVMIHLGETQHESRLFFQKETAGFKKIFPEAEFENRTFNNYSEIMDFLDMGKDCIIVHGVQFCDADWDTVKGRDISVVICPRSNLYFTGKLPDVKKVIDSGVRWAIGSDSLFTNTDLDVLSEARFLYHTLGKKTKYGNEIIRALTYGGREVLGVNDDGITAGNTINFVFFPGDIDKVSGVVNIILDSSQKPIYCRGAADYGLVERFKE